MLTERKRILIVEDDLISAEYIKELLIEQNYEVYEISDTAADAIKQAKKFKPDLILMDIMLKGQMSGLEAAMQIHQDNPNIKIIFLTAYSEEEMIEYAVDANADAYLLKPYRDDEILATIKLQLADNSQKPQAKETDDIMLKGGYRYNTKLCRLFKGNEEVAIGKTPLKLIDILVKNINVSVSNEQICTYIWGERKNDKTLRSLIHRIRSKISHDIIQNINGLGYKISLL